MKKDGQFFGKEIGKETKTNEEKIITQCTKIANAYIKNDIEQPIVLVKFIEEHVTEEQSSYLPGKSEIFTNQLTRDITVKYFTGVVHCMLQDKLGTDELDKLSFRDKKTMLHNIPFVAEHLSRRTIVQVITDEVAIDIASKLIKYGSDIKDDSEGVLSVVKYESAIKMLKLCSIPAISTLALIRSCFRQLQQVNPRILAEESIGKLHENYCCDNSLIGTSANSLIHIAKSIRTKKTISSLQATVKKQGKTIEAQGKELAELRAFLPMLKQLQQKMKKDLTIGFQQRKTENNSRIDSSKANNKKPKNTN